MVGAYITMIVIVRWPLVMTMGQPSLTIPKRHFRDVRKAKEKRETERYARCVAATLDGHLQALENALQGIN